MKILICGACGRHEFVVFNGPWLPTEPTQLSRRIQGACVACGEAWDIENALWVDNQEEKP
mgnify:CR=1 FL=1